MTTKLRLRFSRAEGDQQITFEPSELTVLVQIYNNFCATPEIHHAFIEVQSDDGLWIKFADSEKSRAMVEAQRRQMEGKGIIQVPH